MDVDNSYIIAIVFIIRFLFFGLSILVADAHQ